MPPNQVKTCKIEIQSSVANGLSCPLEGSPEYDATMPCLDWCVASVVGIRGLAEWWIDYQEWLAHHSSLLYTENVFCLTSSAHRSSSHQCFHFATKQTSITSTYLYEQTLATPHLADLYLVSQYSRILVSSNRAFRYHNSSSTVYQNDHLLRHALLGYTSPTSIPSNTIPTQNTSTILTSTHFAPRLTNPPRR